jgi:hypothetical protein
MSATRSQRIEWVVDAAAAILFAGGVGYALVVTVGAATPTAGGSALAFLASLRALRSIAPDHSGFELPEFEVQQLEFEPLDELLLSESDRLDRQSPAEQSGELVLDDILEQLGPDSRVVRLFDREAMPTAAQLQARIDRHLVAGGRQAPAADASADLYDALAELRQSLR